LPIPVAVEVFTKILFRKLTTVSVFASIAAVPKFSPLLVAFKFTVLLYIFTAVPPSILIPDIEGKLLVLVAEGAFKSPIRLL